MCWIWANTNPSETTCDMNLRCMFPSHTCLIKTFHCCAEHGGRLGSVASSHPQADFLRQRNKERWCWWWQWGWKYQTTAAPPPGVESETPWASMKRWQTPQWCDSDTKISLFCSQNPPKRTTRYQIQNVHYMPSPSSDCLCVSEWNETLSAYPYVHEKRDSNNQLKSATLYGRLKLPNKYLITWILDTRHFCKKAEMH